MHLVHIVPTLDSGGAERLLVALVPLFKEAGWKQEVIILGSGGELLELIRGLDDVNVHICKLARNHPGEWHRGLSALKRHLRSLPKDAVIQGWLYIGNMVSSLAGMVAKGSVVSWGIHSASIEGRNLRWPSRLSLLASRLLTRSSRLQSIVYCTEASRACHHGFGYPVDKGLVIENGIDTQSWAKVLENRQLARKELDVAPRAKVILCMARYAAQKDIPNLLNGYSIVCQHRESVLVLMGRGMVRENRALVRDIEASGLVEEDRGLRLVGMQHNPEEYLAAADVTVLPSSFGEALPLCALESLAAGIPMVATNVGGIREIRNKLPEKEFLSIVPPRRPELLAGKIIDVLNSKLFQDEEGREKCRKAIDEHYSLFKTADQYARLYKQLRR